MDNTNKPIIPLEEQFKLIADSIPALVWIADIDKLCYFFNAAWLRFTGKTMEEENGKGWTKGVYPEDLPYYLDIYTTSFNARKEFKIEYRLRRYDGEYCWVFDHGVPYYTSDGEFAGYIGSCAPIDEVLRSERIKKNFSFPEDLEKEQALNEELATANEELAASNEELININNELHQVQETLALLNYELEGKVQQRTTALANSEAEAQALNEELTATNEELAAANEELLSTNEELFISQQALNDTIQQLVLSKEETEKSEKLFKSIAVNIPNSLIIIIGHDHRFIAVEGDLMAKMGFNSNDYTGKHPTEVAPPERYEASKELYNRVLAGEQFTVERKGADGSDFKVDFVPLKNAQDEVYAGLIIAIDITDIKKADEKSAMLAAIVQSSDDAIISKTLEGVVTSWNKSAERLFGYTAEEMIGQPILKVIPADRQEEEPLILGRLRKGERVDHFETIRVTKDGRLLDLSLTISPVRDSQGTIIGVSKIARDISEKKRDEIRKNDFIGMVSHELKTPLTSLTTLIQVAHTKLKNSPDAFLAGAMEKAEFQAKKMANMINGFLNISRLESGKIQIDKHRFDVEELIKEVIDDTEMLFSSRDVKFVPHRPVFINADHDKISSVLINLISNAIKYSPKDKPVVVKCELADKQVVISIKDEGLGIKPADTERLFERYYRVENSQTKHISGFGIGLYLSAEIVEHHGGKIWVESEVDKGSTFFFSLPVED
jgi:PAS domain S-box-containing protein